jgi:hypothetical protein
MPVPAALRVQKRRQALRAAGLRPVQIWVPDTRSPNFAAECQLQSLQAAKVDYGDPCLAEEMDQLLKDIEGWTS